MQQMAYMGYQPYQQTIVAPVLFAKSVLPMVPGSHYNHWHVVREDFQMITEHKADADCLRDLENQTNFLISKLRKNGLVPEDCLPDSDDLWVVSSGRKAEERTLHVWGHSKYSEAINHLLRKGFIRQRFAAPLLSPILDSSEETQKKDPATTVFLDPFDGRHYILVDDADGNYQGVDGQIHNAIKEGHTFKCMIRREYLLCIEKIQAAQYALAFLDPPEPAKRWAPVTRRREPKKNSAPASTNCNLRDAESAPNNQLSLQASAQGGTPDTDVCQTSGHFHDTVDTNNMSTIRREFSTNVPISSAISNPQEEAESLRTASWSPETLVGLAKARHTPGLFEVRDDDTDYEGAEKLDGLRLSLGLDPIMFWPLIDQHIMAMMHGETWWATKRKGKNLRFTLVHVASQWHTVEDELKKHPYTPLDTVPYEGPLEDPEDDGQPRDHSWIFGTTPMPDDDSTSVEEATGIVEGSLEELEETIEDAEADSDLPIEAPQPRAVVTGTLRSYAESLLYLILEQHPLLQAYLVSLAPNKYAVRIETPGGPVDFDTTSGWFLPPPEVRDLIEQAVAAQRGGGDGYGYRGVAYDQAWYDAGGVR